MGDELASSPVLGRSFVRGVGAYNKTGSGALQDVGDVIVPPPGFGAILTSTTINTDLTTGARDDFFFEESLNGGGVWAPIWATILISGRKFQQRGGAITNPIAVSPSGRVQERKNTNKLQYRLAAKAASGNKYSFFGTVVIVPANVLHQ